MSVLEAIQFVVHSQPNCKMLGRKRLHKLLLLGAVASDDNFGNAVLAESEFYIHHYGVYSKEVAKSLDSLVFDGMLLKRSEAVGVFGSLVDTYETEREVEIPSGNFRAVISELSVHNTILLEVAANVAFHINSGKNLDQAVKETEELKPVKSDRYLDKSLVLLRETGILD